MIDQLTIPTSIQINGIWQAATWTAQVLDEDTGEILLTAVAGETDAALRLTMSDVALLRSTLPAFGQANARRYDCRTTSERLAIIERRQEEDAVTFGEHARRLSALETAMRLEHSTMHATFNQHQASLDDHERMKKRITILEEQLCTRIDAIDEELCDQTQRLFELEQGKPQPLSAVDALRQIANIQARDPDGLKMTWSEMAIACIDIAKNALESA